mmetsp:Transcript_19808/g.58948  ORF Transcript_19808/g.58948 Transcript_19808/m.58948 type:complete len:204 (+) Transcript_19808:674-1285(+)
MSSGLLLGARRAVGCSSARAEEALVGCFSTRAEVARATPRRASDVVVLDVRDLVRDHGLELALVQRVHEAGRHGHDGVRAAARRERVRLGGRDEEGRRRRPQARGGRGLLDGVAHAAGHADARAAEGLGHAPAAAGQHVVRGQRPGRAARDGAGVELGGACARRAPEEARGARDDAREQRPLRDDGRVHADAALDAAQSVIRD